MNDIFDFDQADQYAVMGNPIKHSKSPLIHKAFADQTGQLIEYTAIQVDAGGFSQAVAHFQGHGGKGLNVTVPFKIDAWQLSNTLSERAKRAGAVNTLILKENGSIHGDNTDGIGLVNDIANHLGWPITNQKILILGAGGASRGVIAPLLGKNPEVLFVANRTASKAKELAADFSNIKEFKNININGGGYNDLIEQQFDLIINATAASLQGEVPPIPEALLNSSCYCYDMMYADKATAFMQYAEQQGVHHIADGLGMLVGQAAESFNLWRGVKPEVTGVIQTIRQSM